MTDLESSAIMGGITQMGARVYLPILGRFLQVDPVEGGTDNNYAYANDPVNEFDLDGRFVRGAWDNTKKAVKNAAKWAWKHREEIGAVAGTIACIMGTAGVCAGVAVVNAAVSGLAAGYSHYRKTRNIYASFYRGVFAGGKDFAVNQLAGKLARAKYVPRYFGRVVKTGKIRYYRSIHFAWRKSPVRHRVYRQINAGFYGWVGQKLWK